MREALAVRAVALSLRVFGYSWTCRVVRRLAGGGRGLTLVPEGCVTPSLVAEHVARAASTGILPVGCLPRAILTAALLEGRGIEVAVRIGVRREGGTLAAHAWVEHEGLPIAEPGDVATRFAAFDRDFRAIRP